MTSKNLTGWLLIIGTVGSLIVFIGLEPALIGGGNGPSGRLAALMNNVILSRVILILGAVLFSAQIAGFALIANSMKGEDKAGGGVASLASILFTVVITALVIGNGYQLGMMDLGSSNPDVAANLLQASSGLWEPVGYFIPIAVFLLGIGILNQKNFHAAIGWIFVVIGILTFLREIIGLDAIQLVQWIVTSVYSIIVGIVVLRSK